MKKILILILLVTSLGMLQRAQAISGTCSYHGGVNCSAGADWDGSAICKDGWRDSTELYSQTILCQNTPQNYLCTESESAQLDIKYGVPELKKQYDDAFAKLTEMYSEYNALSNSLGNVYIGADAQTLQTKSAEIQLYAATVEGLRLKYKLAFDQSLAECRALGATEYQQELQKALNEIEEIKRQSALEQLQTQCPSNSVLKTDGKCYCSAGYTNSNIGSGCVSLDNWCKEQYQNTYYDGVQKKCECLKGYGPADNKCIPIDEYCINNFGKNSISINNACTCKPGYNWNSNNTSCIAVETEPSTQRKVTVPAPKIQETPKAVKVEQIDIVSSTNVTSTIKNFNTSSSLTENTPNTDKPQENINKKSTFSNIAHGFKNVIVKIFKKLKFW